MLHLLDQLLRDLLTSRIPGLVEDQVRFDPPDEDFRNYVANLPTGTQPAGALNIYLTAVRENRGLRSNKPQRRVVNGEFFDRPAPMQLDCHYLMTAWSPAKPSIAVEPTQDEHALLYSATAVLASAGYLVPAAVYPKNSPKLAPWSGLGGNEIPILVAPAEGFPQMTEFWTDMGQGAKWKPGVQLSVTIPVVLAEFAVGGIVTSIIADYESIDHPELGGQCIAIGGHVFSASGGGGAAVAVPRAWVALETPAGVQVDQTKTDEAGQFKFARLRAASYRLRTRVAGFPEKTRQITVPASSQEYDLTFP